MVHGQWMYRSGVLHEWRDDGLLKIQQMILRI